MSRAAGLSHAAGSAESKAARAFELRAAAGLARLLLASGLTADARHLLAPVYDSFTEGHDTADLAAARLLLSEIP